MDAAQTAGLQNSLSSLGIPGEVPASFFGPGQEFSECLVRAGFVDRSMTRRIRVSGNDRLDLLHRLSTNDLLHLRPGQVRPTVFATDKGRIVDHVLVMVRDQELILLTSSLMEDALTAWIGRYTITEDIQTKDVTQATKRYSIWGPQSFSLAQGLTKTTNITGALHEIGRPWGSYYLACSPGPAGDSIEIVCPAEHAEEIEGEIREAAVVRMGQVAAEAVRIMLGVPVCGRELQDAFNPYEAGLRSSISFTKGCYLGQEVIARLDTYNKVQRRPAGVIVDGFVPSAPTMLPLHLGGEIVGHMTSCAAILEKTVGFAVVRKEVPDGASLSIGGEKSGLPTARITPFPIRLEAVVGSSQAGKER